MLPGRDIARDPRMCASMRLRSPQVIRSHRRANPGHGDDGPAPRRGTGLPPTAAAFARAQARRRVTARTLARRWLLGELDDQVTVPIAWVSDALGIDAATLARIVQREL